jgi:hypothetical protein
VVRLSLVLLIGALPSGCYLSHTRGDDAGPGVDARRDAPSVLPDAPAPLCEVVSPDEWIVPVATLGGEHTTEIPVGMRVHDGGCACTPRGFDEAGRVGAELCRCCDACDCVPPAYEVTVVHTEVAGITRYEPIAPNGARGPVVEVVPWGTSCAPISEPADLVEIRIPDGTAVPAQPVGVWAHVRGVHLRCSGRVLPLAVARGAVVPPELAMEDCSPDFDPCGPITPTPYETDVFVGFLDAGAHHLRAFGRDVEVFVP